VEGRFGVGTDVGAGETVGVAGDVGTIPSGTRIRPPPGHDPRVPLDGVGATTPRSDRPPERRRVTGGAAFVVDVDESAA
jgi:hypothetical protein